MAFANNPSANIKLSKTQLHKIGQSGGFLGRFLGPLLKAGLSLTGNVLKPLAKSVSIPLQLTAAASATNAGLLIKGVNETIKNEAEEQKGGFLGILLGTLGVTLLRNLLTGKGTIRVGEETIRAGENF